MLSALLSATYGTRPVLRECALEVRRGEILGLAGSSGSGKSTLALALLNLLDPRTTRVSGHVHFNGRDLLTLTDSELRAIRGREVALVLQSPAAALNPALRIGTQMREAWRAHQKSDGADAVAEALAAVSLPSDSQFLKRYPSQISTGQGQRVLIAMAILHRPQLLIADEPTSALDAITQIEVLELLSKCNREFGCSVLLISHDLGALATICNRVAVLSEGSIVECGTVDHIFRSPTHAFTRRLTGSALASLRSVDLGCVHDNRA
ncbi:MAG TPA: ABC transporter ATP-binding protein [Terriglobales bacterium]|nr:ABC transporter ATP-binding protein [Terriglobales bacterium]